MKHLKEELSKAKLADVIKTLLTHFATNANNIHIDCIDYYTQIIMLSGDYHEIINRYNMKLINFETYRQGINQVRHSLLRVLDMLPCELCTATIKPQCLSNPIEHDHKPENHEPQEPQEIELYNYLLAYFGTQAPQI